MRDRNELCHQRSFRDLHRNDASSAEASSSTATASSSQNPNQQIRTYVRPNPIWNPDSKDKAMNNAERTIVR